MVHRVELDSVKKYRNKSEYRTVDRAKWQHLESVGDGENIVKLAKQMLSEGVSGRMDVYRGKTPVFLGGTVEQWSEGRPGRGEQPAHLRKREKSDG